MSVLTPFHSIIVAHNESADYYTINRAFSRMYDVISTAVSAGSIQYPTLSSIPYATELSQGFSQFTTSISGVNDNKLISSSTLSSYINTISLSSRATSTMNSSTFNVVSGGGRLLNDIKFQYGFTPLNVIGSLSLTSFLTSGNVMFQQESSMKFTQIPFISIQLLDYTDNSKYLHKFTLFDVTSTSFKYVTYSKKIGTSPTNKSPFYLTWLAIGV